MESIEGIALLGMLDHLRSASYRFITPTPATHARILARPHRQIAASLTDALGWSLPFTPGTLDPIVEKLLGEAGMLVLAEGVCKSRVRVSSLHDRLYLHSAYPTDEVDAVFFGPDSYRFADLIVAEHDPQSPASTTLDIGTGAGVGGITAAMLNPGATVTITDINPLALRLARLNAQHAGITAHCIEGADLSGAMGSFDLITINPPYIIDPAGRAYRHGGDMHGARIALDMTRMALDRLAPGGKLILYTGSAIINGDDPLREAITQLAANHDCALRYRELDPDIFGEELDRPYYSDVDRIALVAAIIHRPG